MLSQKTTHRACLALGLCTYPTQMRVVGTFPAAVFLSIFTIVLFGVKCILTPPCVVVLLMLNMLLALIVDAYSNVKRDSSKAETLWR